MSRNAEDSASAWNGDLCTDDGKPTPKADGQKPRCGVNFERTGNNMTHIFIEENTPTDWGVHYGDFVIHVEDSEQAQELALKIAEKLGLIGY